MRRLREWCDRAVVLCGTPAPNAPIDVVAQFDLVDFGTTFAGIVIPKDRASARSVIRDAMERRGIFVRSLKADVLPELPTKSITRVLVPFEPRQRQIYESFLTDLIGDLQRVDDATFARTARSFLASACIGLMFAKVSGNSSPARAGVC